MTWPGQAPRRWLLLQEADSELERAERDIAAEEKDLLSNIDDIVRSACRLPAGPDRSWTLLGCSITRATRDGQPTFGLRMRNESCLHLQVDFVLNKTKEDLFSSPILSEAYAAGAIKGDFALPSGYSPEAVPSGWEKA